ncbi:MAG: pyruvate formate-lyase-activating protein [Firmicutes bacterium]|nr:pyruvate formate-lyase-activating protein [Bacillota bacterium]
MKIHSIETLGAHDGPGIRTVVFFQGCPMRCSYCHNPDMFCAAGGEEKSVEELVRFCTRYKNYYGHDGGVTLSGGEPLLQYEAAAQLLTALKKEGIHTALDTSGAVFNKKALAAADLVILDIKHTDPSAFLDLTGHAIFNTLKALEFLKSAGKPFWVRQVIVKGITDGHEQILALKKMAAGAARIELLPYHTLGVHKWEKCGLDYTLADLKPPSEGAMEKLKRLL